MSTSIDQIINSLQANAKEKKKQIHNSYSEKSMWLANEFALIKKLIQNNPRDNRIPMSETSGVEQSATAVGSSSEVRTSLDKKRKVPDTTNTVKLSPEQKRASIDADDIISQAGLPSDLNKLTKEQLLKELKKLGRTEYTAKQVKKDLVDGLRDALVEAHRAKQAPVDSAPAPVAMAVSEEISVADQESNVASSSEMVLSTPGKPTSNARRGSQMSDFRSIVTQQVASVTTSAAAPAIESEFQARQNRHRESVARKSIVVAAPESAAPPAPAVVAPTTAVLPPAAPCAVLDKSSIYPEDGVWMEVSSPVKAPAEADDSAAGGQDAVEEVVATELDESEPVIAQAEAVAVPTEAAPAAEEEGHRLRSESDASFVSCLSAASAPKSVAAGSAKEITSSARPGANNTAASGPRSASNLRAAAEGRAVMSAAAAKPSVPVVPTSQKAKMTSSTVQPGSASAVPSFKKKDPLPEMSTKSVAKPAASAPSTTSHSSAPAATASTAGATAAAPAKKGIFGFLSNNKKPATTAAATPAGTNASAVPTPVPAMVDAIIKSHKADSVVTNTTAPIATPAVAAPSTSIKAPTSDASRVQTPPDVKEAIQLSSASKAAATPLNNAFNSKSLISNIVNNYNNALKSGNSAVHGPGGSAASVATSPAPVAPVPRPTPTAQAAQPAVLRDITPGSAAAQVAPPAKPAATPAPAPAESACQGYQIEDRESSDESGTDGEEETEESRKRKAAMVPAWARGPQLKEALERQYGMHGEAPMDPDLIFPEVTTCSLEEIFGASANRANKSYSKRSSSAHWDADQMTLVEKRTYRKHMGYDRAPTVLHNHAHLQQVGGVAMPGAR